MKKTILFLISIFLISIVAKAGWNVTPTGFNDNFNGVYFGNATGSQNYGLLAGSHGLYYTQTGPAGSWNRFNVTSNTADSIIYNNCAFYKITSLANNGQVFIIGKDTVADKAVIFSFNIGTLVYSIDFMGATGTRLNGISCYGNANSVYAVGNNGLIVRKYNTGSFAVSPTSTTANLYAVSAGPTTQVVAGGDEIILKGFDNGTSLNLTAYSSPTHFFKDVLLNSTNYFVGSDYASLISADTSVVDLPNYDFGPLNASAICNGNSASYVATDHGIYKTAYSNNRLEFQPSSSGYALNDIFFQGNNPITGHACGNNGVYLTTTDGGGITKPYCSINAYGGCKSVNINFNGIPGTGTNYRWYVNNVQVSQLSTTSYSFPTAGTYQVKYIVWNSSLMYDTAMQSVIIVDPPLNNLTVTLSDSILCKTEPLGITIQNSQLNTVYKFNLTNQTYGTGYGNGSILNFTTSGGLAAGSYSVIAQSTLVPCTKTFTQVFPVAVENTKSAMHYTLFNAEPGEPVTFNATSTDAQNFSWIFGPNSSTPGAAQKVVSNVTFGTTGNTNIQLISWSNNGCYDTLTANGPFIYNEPAIDDTCYSLSFDDNDPSPGGYYINKLNQSFPLDDGFLACGSAFEDSFKTRYGMPPERTIGGGGYITKYSYNGTFKWAITSDDPDYFPFSYRSSNIASVTSDSSGNIYVAGVSNQNTYFTDNYGEKIKIADPIVTGTFSPDYGFIAKFNSEGKFIWSSQVNAFYPTKIKVDRDNNLVIIGEYQASQYSLNYYYQGTIDTICYLPIFFVGETNVILKTDSAGLKLWSTVIVNHSLVDNNLKDFDMDDANNIYVCAYTRREAEFYNVGTNNAVNMVAVDSIQLASGSTGTMQAYIVKYDSNGMYQWHNLVRMKTTSSYCEPKAIVVDGQGNSYLAGRSAYSGLTADSLFIENASGSVLKKKMTGYYLLKTDSAGENVWVAGCDSANYGVGGAVFLKNNELLVSGSLISQANLWTGNMFSTDGNDLNFSINQSDIFIASYDTAGVINYVTKTGYNTNAQQDMYDDGAAVFKNSQGHVFITGDFRTYIGTYIHYFSDSLTANRSDGFIAKMGSVPCNLYMTSIPAPEKELQTGIKIYPNPTNGTLHVQMQPVNSGSAEQTICITDVVGKIIYKAKTIKPAVEIEISKIAGQGGIYFIAVENAHEKWNSKFVYLNK